MMLWRLLPCSIRVAQRQLRFEYPSQFFLRSRLVPLGLSPISARKFRKSRQRLQTAMPLPPYLLYAWWCVLLHRLIIAFHDLYVGDCAIACP